MEEECAGPPTGCQYCTCGGGVRGWECAADAYASAGPIPAPSTCVEASGEPPTHQFYPMSDVRMLMHASCTCGVVVDVRVLVLRLVGRFTSYVSQRSCRRAVERSARPHIDVLAVHTAGRTHRGRIMHLRVSCMMRAHMRCSEQCSSASGSRTCPPTPAAPSARPAASTRAVAASGDGYSSHRVRRLRSTTKALVLGRRWGVSWSSRGAATGMGRRAHLPHDVKQALSRDTITCRS